MDVKSTLPDDFVKWWTILTLYSGEVMLVTSVTWPGGYMFPSYDEAMRGINALVEEAGILRWDLFLSGVGPEDLPPRDPPSIRLSN